jgi:hypothetical protein
MKRVWYFSTTAAGEGRVDTVTFEQQQDQNLGQIDYP